jgi:hypothetical protein
VLRGEIKARESDYLPTNDAATSTSKSFRHHADRVGNGRKFKIRPAFIVDYE